MLFLGQLDQILHWSKIDKNLPPPLSPKFYETPLPGVINSFFDRNFQKLYYTCRLSNAGCTLMSAFINVRKNYWFIKTQNT